MSTSDKERSINWAKHLLADGDFVILDTETTGLNRERDDVPVAIAVIASDGAVLIDSLVNCGLAVEEGAAKIHGIDDALIEAAPTWADVRSQVGEAIRGKTIVVYNANFDFQIVYNAEERIGAHPDDNIAGVTRGWQCAMQQYAAFWGDWNDYHHSYRWQRLTAACAQQEIEVTSKAHSALGDCQRTLALLKAMAKAEVEAI